MNQLFEYYTENEHFHLKYARGEAALQGNEFHDYDEVLLFLGGESRFVSKNIQQDLSVGTLVLIPKEHFHRFHITHSETYTRCIFGFRETPELKPLIREVMSEVQLITVPNEKIRSLFVELMEIAKSDMPDTERHLFIGASLVQLLIYCKQQKREVIREDINISPLVRETIGYIDKHFSEKLTVDEIARQYHVSSSTLAHKFKKELNVSVYRYITKKCLSAARQMIEQGESLMRAAENCGFSDYSCFYRMYKKAWGRTEKGAK